MAYNIESLIQRGGAQVSLNVEGGALTVALKAVDPTVEDAEAVAIDRALLRDVQATLSNNNYPTTGYCEISDGDNDGELVISAPSNMPLIEGENLIVLSGVYCGAMFVQSYSVTGVAEGNTTASAAITLNIIGSTPASGGNEHITIDGDVMTLNDGLKVNSDTKAVAEGKNTTASGDYSHAEGNGTTASEYASHAEGKDTVANGETSHAEGDSTLASGDYSHAEGNSTVASEYASHAEGNSTVASGENSHAEGDSTIASQMAQHAGGKYNVDDTGNLYAFIIGNGTYEARHNAFAIGWNGSLYLFQQDGTPVELTPAKLATLVV